MLAIVLIIICHPFCLYLCRLCYTRSKLSKKLLGRSSRSRDFLQWADPLSRSWMARERGEGERPEHHSASTGQGPPDGLAPTSAGLLCLWATYPVSHASWAPVALALDLAFLKGWLEQGCYGNERENKGAFLRDLLSFLMNLDIFSSFFFHIEAIHSLNIDYLWK